MISTMTSMGKKTVLKVIPRIEYLKIFKLLEPKVRIRDIYFSKPFPHSTINIDNLFLQ